MTTDWQGDEFKTGFYYVRWSPRASREVIVSKQVAASSRKSAIVAALLSFSIPPGTWIEIWDKRGRPLNAYKVPDS